MQGTARRILSTEIAVVDPHAPLAEAEALLLRQGVDELFVVDETGRLLGIVPDYVLLRRRLVPDGAGRVAEIMSTHVLTASPDASLTELASRLRMHVHPRVPIVEDGRLIGMVTRRDLLQTLATAECRALEDEGCIEAPPVPAQPPAAPNFLKSPRLVTQPAD